jgi:hypothetical protein
MQQIDVEYNPTFPWPEIADYHFFLRSYRELGFYSIWARDILMGLDLGSSQVITGKAIKGCGSGVKITMDDLEEMMEDLEKL